MPGRPIIALAIVGAVLAVPFPAAAHSGSEDGSRPIVAGVEPSLPGVAVSTAFVGDWQVRLSVTGDRTVSVLDDDGRPFVRIGPDGVQGDYATAAWYRSAVLPAAPGAFRLPAGVGGGALPDWRRVSVERSWSWFDSRTRAEAGLVSPEIVERGVPTRLRDFRIPLRIGERAASIQGHLAFEPPAGRYRHTLLGSRQLAAGVEIDLVQGRVIPTVALENTSDQTVVVLGDTGEPFLRVGQTVEANLASPTWVEFARSLGRVPQEPADAGATPVWKQVGQGRVTSWTDFRSRPPDDEPPTGLPSGGALLVRRWTIPFRIGDRPVEVRGITELEPFPRSDPDSPATPVIAGLAAVLVFAAAASVARPSPVRLSPSDG